MRIPSKKGHELLTLSLQEAQHLVTEKLQQGWIATLNGKAIRTTDEIKDDSELSVYPPIAGG